MGSFVSAQDAGDLTFSCGVASGDPGREDVVLWTRIGGAEGRLPVVAEVAEDDSFSRIVFSENLETGPERDYTVKTLASGLEPGRRYAYRFRVFDRTSPTGFTRTLPERTDSARFAVVSCSNYPFGYFNAYDHIARQEGIDAVLHLGDYIYEYGPEGYGGEVGAALGRAHDPAREIISLGDYRRRHRQYKMDPASQRMHMAHPLIAIWDDHETTNDSFKTGAENHQPADEGDWESRKRAALQAYYEYMPIREPQRGRTREAIYRSFQWGEFLTLASLESRLTARTKPINYDEVVPTLTSPEAVETFRREVLGQEERELLGAGQRQFLGETLGRSVRNDVPWRVVANQVLFARVTAPDLGAYVTEEDIQKIEKQWPSVRSFLAFSALGLPLNTDSWDGYPAARERFYQTAEDAGARDLLVLTGDTHQFWANDLKRDDGRDMGVELGTSGVTSPGPSAYLGERAFDFTLLLRKQNPEIRYTDPASNGYILLEFKEDEAEATFIAVDRIDRPDYKAIASAAFDIEKRNGSLALTNPRGLGFKERVLYR
jgi:phosphodiesterase/alkaline phosphatase D-like protein